MPMSAVEVAARYPARLQCGGRMRVEGKTYQVGDGDVLLFPSDAWTAADRQGAPAALDGATA